MSDLLKLAGRCEQASRPDAELSAEIALAVHDWLHEVEGNKPLNCRIRNSFGSPVYIGRTSPGMHFTESLDAAMSLVPEEWTRGILSWPGYENGKLLGGARMELHHCLSSGGGPLSRGIAATPALALCAAALKARNSLSGNKG